MLLRGLPASARRQVACCRALSSSSGALRDITMVGNASDFEDALKVPSGAARFANLRREAEEQSALRKEPPSEPQAAAKDGTNFIMPDWSARRSTSTAHQRNTPPSLLARSDRTPPMAQPQETGRKNPFNRRSRSSEEPQPQEMENDGWAPGLRVKIAEAQEVEQHQQQQQVRVSEQRIESNDADERGASAHYSPSIPKAFKVRTSLFHPVLGRPCDDILGFEKWSVYPRLQTNGQWHHLFARRYVVNQKSASTLFANVLAAISTTKAIPRSLSLDTPHSRSAWPRQSTIHIELGGWEEEQMQALPKYLCSRFPYHRGLMNADGYAIHQIESAFKLYEEMEGLELQTSLPVSPLQQQGESERDPSPKPVAETQSTTSRSRMSEVLTEDKGVPRKNASQKQRQQQQQRDQPPRREATPKSRNSARQEVQRQDNAARETIARRENTKPDLSIYAKESRIKSWTGLWGRAFKDAPEGSEGASGRENGMLLDTVRSHVQNKDSSSSSAMPRKQGESVRKVKETTRPKESSRRPVEEATPVHIDGEQAKDTASASASDQGVRGAKLRVEAMRVDDSLFDDAQSRNADDIEEATPVGIDGEQAEKAATKAGHADVANSKESQRVPVEEATPVHIDDEQAGATVAEPAGEAAGDKSEVLARGIEESTPVSVDDEQANGTAVASDGEGAKISSTTEQRARRPSLNDTERESDTPVVEESDDAAPTQQGDIEESTPVFVDGTQAEGTANTTGAEHATEMANERQGGESSNDDEAAHSSVPIDDSVPVAVEGEQVGKQQ